MAVYEQTYKRYTGELTPQGRRFLVPMRYALREVFASRMVILLMVVGVLGPVAAAVVIYLHHNASALLALALPIDRLLPIDNRFFEFIIQMQSVEGFFLALLIGPGLIAPDLRNSALPLYFSRPFSRAEYVEGKLGVLVLLLSALTWAPGLLLFLLQWGLEPAWFAKNWSLAWAIVASSLVWILVISLLTLAISAWVKWKAVARIALIAVFFVMHGWGEALNGVLGVRWGSLLSLGTLNDLVRTSLFGNLPDEHLPVWAAWATLTAACLLFLSMLARKVRAYEVVR